MPRRLWRGKKNMWHANFDCLPHCYVPVAFCPPPRHVFKSRAEQETRQERDHPCLSVGTGPAIKTTDLTDNRPSSVHPSSGVRHALRSVSTINCSPSTSSPNAPIEPRTRSPGGKPVTGPSQLSKMVRQPARSSSLLIICHHQSWCYPLLESVAHMASS